MQTVHCSILQVLFCFEQSTFGYNSQWWTNKESFAVENGLEGLAKKESKLASYWNTPFKKICVGMAFNGETKWMEFNYKANSLYSLIADGKFRNTSAGRASWLSLISVPYIMQPNCNVEGFNIRHPFASASARLGFVGNNEYDCITCDSWMGFSVRYTSCGARNIPAFGYIFVQ